MNRKYLVGYAGDGQVVYGRDAGEFPCTEPMTLRQALRYRKSRNVPGARVRLYKLVVVLEWVNGRVRNPKRRVRV